MKKGGVVKRKGSNRRKRIQGGQERRDRKGRVRKLGRDVRREEMKEGLKRNKFSKKK